MSPKRQAFEAYLFLDRKLKNRATLHTMLNHWYEFFDDKRDFTRETFTSFISHLMDRGMSLGSLNNFIALGKNYDKFQGTHHLEDYKYFIIEDHEVEVLTISEIKSLYTLQVPYARMSTHLNLLYGLIIELIALTGCRINEALDLRKKHLFATPPSVYFAKTKTAKPRRVPIPYKLYERLRDLSSDDYVFTSYRGKKLDTSGVNQDLHKRARILGIKKKVHAHIFRHSFITECIKRGVPIIMISRMVGHADIQTTNKYYSHLDLEDIANAVSVHPLLSEGITLDFIRIKVQEMIAKLTDGTQFHTKVSTNPNELCFNVTKSR